MKSLMQRKQATLEILTNQWPQGGLNCYQTLTVSCDKVLAEIHNPHGQAIFKGLVLQIKG